MELLHGHFHFKVLPDGGTKVICSHCQVEFSYHQSTSSLKYHLNAKHTVDTHRRIIMATGPGHKLATGPCLHTQTVRMPRRCNARQ